MTRWPAIVLGFGALLLTACEQKKEDPSARTEELTPTDDSTTSLDSMTTPTPAYTAPPPSGGYTASPAYVPTNTDSTSYTATPTYTSSSDTQPPPSNAEELLAPESGGGKTYVVKRGDNLHKISKAQYGTTKRWREIYTANKARIGNPNKLKIGTKLIIP